MPRNKLAQDREEKRAEIVSAARRLFLQDGYDATSMSKLATEAGIAPNTIYWYFDDKDDVLVAVLDVELADGFQAYQHLRSRRIVERMLWLLERLQQASRLVTTVHARVALSARVHEWHERFHELVETMIHAELEQRGLPAKQRDAAAKIWVFTMEGVLAHPMTRAKQRAICEALAGMEGRPSGPWPRHLRQPRRAQ
jgi:AcrR family transcriptional regulator